ncbi:MAG: MBL fold metallo-hydrolase, partial [Gemmataceae bacterium]|nr:MBL fold metallo-hydrolase [Gemmataceae bacterium]
PVYVDSPLATDIASHYMEYADHLQSPDREDVPVEYVLSQDRAMSRSMQRDPCIIVASGGMCEGGRVLSHLRQHIDDPRSAIVLVSYQSPLSLGAQLMGKTPTVRFHGRTWNKWVEVAKIDGFSGHADSNDFAALLGGAAGRTGKVRLVHGEPEACEALTASLQGMGFADVRPPEYGELATVA